MILPLNLLAVPGHCAKSKLPFASFSMKALNNFLFILVLKSQFFSFEVKQSTSTLLNTLKNRKKVTATNLAVPMNEHTWSGTQ